MKCSCKGNKMFKKLLSVLAAVLLAGCGTPVQDSPGSVRARGVLRVGASGDCKPMSFREPATGKYWGFDAALAEDLAREMGVKLEFVPTSWPTLRLITVQKINALQLPCRIPLSPEENWEHCCRRETKSCGSMSIPLSPNNAKKAA